MSEIVSDLFDVTLHASNLEELGRFYASLGLRQAIDDHDLKVFILGQNELEILRDPSPQIEPATIRVRVEQLASLQLRLREQAIAHDESQRDDHGASVLVRDPNGNLVQFVEGRN